MSNEPTAEVIADQARRTSSEAKRQARRERDLAGEAEKLEQHRRKADAAIKARGEQLQKLRASGPGITLATSYQLHLVTAKRGKKDKLAPRHGVTFRRRGADLLIECSNDRAFVSLLRQGDGEAFAPGRSLDPRVVMVAPAKAMELIAKAQEGLAQLWFAGGKVSILVDDALHEFWQIPCDELPFDDDQVPMRDRHYRSAMVGGFGIEAAELLKLQKALGADQVEIRRASKGLLSVFPSWQRDADQPVDVGFICVDDKAPGEP